MSSTATSRAGKRRVGLTLAATGLLAGVPLALAASPAGAAARPSAVRAGAVTARSARLTAQQTRPAATSASALLSKSAAAVRKEKGVVESASETQGSDSASFSLHAGTSGGEETVNFVESKAKGTATVLELSSHLYLKGDHNGLTDTGFTTAAASSEANRWIDIPTSSTYGKDLASGLTIASTAADLQLSGKLSVTKATTVDGQRVVGVTESESGATIVIYVRDSSTPLPVEISFKASGENERVDFQSWGSPPKLAKPSPTVSFKSSWVKSS